MKSSLPADLLMRSSMFGVRCSTFIGALIGAIFYSLFCTHAPAVPPTGDADTLAERVSQKRTIAHTPLMWVGTNTPAATDSQALLDVLVTIDPADEDDPQSFSGADIDDLLTTFIGSYPASQWVPSLRNQLCEFCRDNNLLSRGLAHAQAVWSSAASLTNSANDNDVADVSLVQLAETLVALGRTEEMTNLLAAASSRTLDYGPLRQRLNKALENYGKQKSQPGLASRCGFLALYQVAKVLAPSASAHDFLADVDGPTNGCSLAKLGELGTNLNLVAAARTNSVPFPVPSIVHWQAGHYAAIVEQNDSLFKVLDPIHPRPVWLTASEVAAEASGYFLIPQSSLTNGWRSVGQQEAESVIGRGYSASIDDSSDYFASMGERPGLPNWRVSEPFVSLWIQAGIVQYPTSAGRNLQMAVAYSQRSSFSHSSEFSFGPSWECSWLSYVDYTWKSYWDPEAEMSELFISFGPDLHAPLGGLQLYSQDPNTPEYNSYSRIEKFGSITRPCGSDFVVSYSDGSRREYSYGVCVYGHYKRKYLSAFIDAQGRRTTFNYSTNYQGKVRLTSVVDFDNHTNRLIYDTAFPMQVSQVIDPFGRTNKFYYNSSGALTNIVNAEEMSCRFTADVKGVITNMSSPYGNTVFQYTANSNAGNVITRSMQVTEPDGRKHLFIYRDRSTKLNEAYSTDLLPCSYPTNEVPNTSPFTNSFDNTWMDARNSFYWSPRCYAELSTNFTQTGNFTNLTLADYKLARLRHWLLKQAGPLGATLSLERGPSPDGIREGLKQWFDYRGKPAIVTTNCSGQTVTNYYREGGAGSPWLAAIILPDGSTRFDCAEVNDWGLPTNSVSTYAVGAGVGARTNTFGYTNGVDLAWIKGPSGELLLRNVFDSSHHVLTNYDALDQATSFLYNSLGQTIRIVSQTGLTTTNIYFTSGQHSNFLQATIQLEIGRTNTFTYTNALIWTHTDERGLATTNAFDQLQRLLSVADPRGAILFTYNRLDVVQIADRMHYTNWFGFDDAGRLRFATNALGYYTAYEYCDCGALSSIRDPENHFTFFYYDNLSRLIVTLYPDGTAVTNHYNSIGQVTNVVSSTGASLTNWFNHQGLLLAASNALGRIQSLIYDQRDRATNSTDVNGLSIGTVLDSLGRVRIRLSPEGQESFGYSAAGVIAYTNQLGLTNFFAYDKAASLRFTTNANAEVTESQYDSSGIATNLIDGKRHSTFFRHDIYGRFFAKLDHLGTNLFQLQYDANDRVTNRITASGAPIGYGYDPMGTLTNIHYSNGTNIFFAPDAAGRVTNVLDEVGVTSYTFDAAGQTLSENGPWASDTISYLYRGSMRTSLSLLQPNAAPWTNGYFFDHALRLTNITSQAGAFGYSYNGSQPALLAKRSFPGGAYVTNAYDLMSRVGSTALRNSLGSLLHSHAYQYNSADQPTQQVFTAGNYIDYSYDRAGRLKAALGREPGGAVNRLQEQFGYGYDAAGNLGYTTNNALVRTFDVNTLNQLTTISRNAANALTVAGIATRRATNVTINGLAANLYVDRTFSREGFNLTNGLNAFTAIGWRPSGAVATNTVSLELQASNSFLYDLSGNMVSDGIHGFDYDDENQLRRITCTNAWKSEFSYDYRGRRRIGMEFAWQAGAWVKTNEIRYIYDGGLVLQERDSNNIPIVTYTRGLDLSQSLQGAGGIGGLLSKTDHMLADSRRSTCFYFCDAGGSVTALFGTNQLICATYAYDPYGGLLYMSGPLASANRYRFSSKELHENSGLVYFGRRYYHTTLQRWLNRDPIGERGGLNLYQYAGNSPIRRIDSWGGWATLIRIYQLGGQGYLDRRTMPPMVVEGNLPPTLLLLGDLVNYGGRESPPGSRERNGAEGDGRGDPGNNSCADNGGSQADAAEEDDSMWYDRWGDSIGRAAESAKNLNNRKLLWPLAGSLNTGIDLVSGFLQTPKALGHLGEGSGKFSANPTLENSAGMFLDISLAAGTIAGGLPRGPGGLEAALIARDTAGTALSVAEEAYAVAERNYNAIQQDLASNLAYAESEVGRDSSIYQGLVNEWRQAQNAVTRASKVRKAARENWKNANEAALKCKE